MSPEEEAAKSRRTVAKQRFTRCRNNLLDGVRKQILTKTVANRFAELKDAWSAVQEKHEQYVALSKEDVDQESWIDDLSTQYCEAEEETDRYLEGIKVDEKQKEIDRRKNEKLLKGSQEREDALKKKLKDQEAWKEEEWTK